MDAEHEYLKDMCARFSKETGIPVESLKVPYKDLRDKFLIAAPAGLGPDILVGAHDWMGILQIAGTLQPIPTDKFSMDDVIEVCREAVTFEGQVYSVPLCMESLAMIRNKDLMPNSPQTCDDLIKEATQIQTAHPDVHGIYFEIREPYYAFPFFFAEGGYLLGKNPDGSCNPKDIGINKPGSVKAAIWLSELITKHKLIKSGASDTLSKDLFKEGKAAVIFNGPWFLKDMKEAKVNYAIDPYPMMDSGRRPQPFVGVQGMMFNKNSNSPENAIRLMQYLSSTEAVVGLTRYSGRPPATKSALAEIQDDPDIAAFANIAKDGVPMPTHPAVGTIWEPLKGSLELISTGSVDPKEELDTTASRVAEKIQLMLE